nr:hypothetical protein [uncultured Dyadobacter sp.]
MTYDDIILLFKSKNIAEAQDLVISKKFSFHRTSQISGKTHWTFLGDKVRISNNPSIGAEDIIIIVTDSDTKQVLTCSFGTVSNDVFLAIVGGMKKNTFTAVDSFEGEKDESMPESLVLHYKNPVGTSIYTETYKVRKNGSENLRFRVYN